MSLLQSARSLRSLSLICVCLLAGCTAIQSALSFIPGIPDPKDTRIRGVTVQADPDANQDSATELDFLFLLDPDLLETLPPTAPEWFEKRQLLLSNHRHSLLWSELRLAPATTETLEMPKGYKKAQDVIVYANFISAGGQKWYRLPNAKHVNVRLKKAEVELSDEEK